MSLVRRLFGLDEVENKWKVNNTTYPKLAVFVTHSWGKGLVTENMTVIALKTQ